LSRTRLVGFQNGGLWFDVSDSGPLDGQVVIALHGFPEDRHCFGGLSSGLASSGYRVLRPDQRGYSRLARPACTACYSLARLRSDVEALADAAEAESFHLVGHDWGAVVAWDLAARRPGRVRSLCALSVPHPGAFAKALRHRAQLARSWYILAFCIPGLAELAFLGLGPSRVAAGLSAQGLDPATARRYARRLCDPVELRGPLSWYRAMPTTFTDPMPSVEVPTLMIWGSRDRYVSRLAIDACSAKVRGPYRRVDLPGASHWLPSSHSSELVPLVFDHLRAHGSQGGPPAPGPR